MASRWSDDRGETLIELLVAILVIGTAVVAITGGLLTSVQFSDVHRKQATGGAYARNYAESVDRYVAGGHYTPCAGSPGQPTYAAAFATVALPTGFKPPVATYRNWDPAWTPGSSASPWLPSTSPCTVSSDAGLQQVTVLLESTDGRASERSVVVVRKP